MPEAISCTELRALMDSDELYALFDVREQGEYNERQIYKATSLPRRQIEFRLPDLVPAADVPVIVYDDGGERASLAAATMESMGYRAVKVLDGGLPAWLNAGYTNVSGVNVPSKEFGEHLAEAEPVPDLTPEELHARLGRGDQLTLIDVRTPEEFGRFCIPGAGNIPGGNLILWADTLRDSTVIVNCAGRTRSIVGTATLRRLGLKNVYALRNGTMGWLLAGFGLEQKPQRTATLPADASRERAANLAELVARDENVSPISVSQLVELQSHVAREMFYLIDVRSEDEYEAGHIPGSVNVPGGQAVQRADDFVAVRNARIVFVSDRGSRATMAAYWYRKMGFPKVAALRGGLNAWKQNGREIHSAAPHRAAFGYENLKRSLRFVAPRDLNQWLSKQEAVVLDVSTSVEFEAAHVPGARWISRGWLDLKTPSLFPDRGSRLALACADGQNSVLAARMLADIGYSDVSVLQGGMHGWIAAGLRTSKGLENCLVDANDVVLSPSIRGDTEAMKRYLEWEVNLKNSLFTSP